MKITFEPIGDKMKTREFPVWVTKTNNYEIDMWQISLHEQPNTIKAKLIIPVEPQTLNFDWDFSNATEKDINWLPLLGRRWKCKFEEIVE